MTKGKLPNKKYESTTLENKRTKKEKLYTSIIELNRTKTNSKIIENRRNSSK